MHHCTPLHSLGMQETKGWNQTPAQRMQIPELEPFSARWMLWISIIRKYSTNTGSITWTAGSRSRAFPRSAVFLLTWQERIPNPSLGSRDSIVQNTWEVFQARTGTQASLNSAIFPAILESYSLACGLSLLLLADLINSPACSSDMGCPNTAQAVGRKQGGCCWLGCCLILAQGILNSFCADHNSSAFKL